MLTGGQLLADCVRWAKEAGRIQLGYFRGDDLGIQTKTNASDVVTNADRAAEEAIVTEIRKKYPEHSILTEESGGDRNMGEYRWVIDPLDGTTNFSSGLPSFCVSIGVERRGETVAGAVFAPYLGELFSAEKGQGAYLNGRRLHASRCRDLAEAVVSTGFPYDKGGNPDCNLDNLARTLPRVRGMRRLGAAAIDICYVAAGFLDAYWELNLHEWDVCAGLLIAAEAGAEIDRFRADRGVSVLVAAPGIMPRIAPLISREPFGGDPFGVYGGIVGKGREL